MNKSVVACLLFLYLLFFNNFVSASNQNERLFSAVKQQKLDAVNDALSNKADVNALDDNEWTPLMYASDNCNADIVQALIKKEVKTMISKY